MNKAKYKTWIRTKPIIIFLILTAISILFLILSVVNSLFLIFIIPTFIFGYILLIVGVSRLRFSKMGGDYQNKIHQMIVSKVEGDRIMDIGCGSGHLLSKIAKQNPESELVGIDYWGDNWEYSKELCINNFRAEKIMNKVEFRKETASNLPDDIGMFDCIVSCLTFHEVQDIDDKTISIYEALGHLKKDGKFIFIDLFNDPKYYPESKKINKAIESQNGIITERISLSKTMELPFTLKHKKVLGYAEMITGRIVNED
jgi:SAM-dependent methyltransferase